MKLSIDHPGMSSRQELLNPLNMSPDLKGKSALVNFEYLGEKQELGGMVQVVSG